MTGVSPAEVVVAAVAGLVAQRPGETVWVGVDGPGGAGKTTFAARLAAALADAAVVHVDDFWGPRIAEWDWDRFARQVRDPLLAGQRARYQVWNWDRDAGGNWQTVRPGVPVIVEGVSSTRSEAGVPWDVRIWVDAPRDVRLQRALARDGPGMMRRWLEDWMPSEERYIAREQPQRRADYVVRGTAD